MSFGMRLNSLKLQIYIDRNVSMLTYLFIDEYYCIIYRIIFGHQSSLICIQIG